jgi:hypothetical protein
MAFARIWNELCVEVLWLCNLDCNGAVPASG